MEKAAAIAAYERLHHDEPFHDGTFTRWAKDRSQDYPYHFNDGVRIWASPIDLNPDDKFTTERSAPPMKRRGGEHGRQA